MGILAPISSVPSLLANATMCCPLEVPFFPDIPSQLALSGNVFTPEMTGLPYEILKQLAATSIQIQELSQNVHHMMSLIEHQQNPISHLALEGAVIGARTWKWIKEKGGSLDEALSQRFLSITGVPLSEVSAKIQALYHAMRSHIHNLLEKDLKPIAVLGAHAWKWTKAKSASLDGIFSQHFHSFTRAQLSELSNKIQVIYKGMSDQVNTFFSGDFKPIALLGVHAWQWAKAKCSSLEALVAQRIHTLPTITWAETSAKIQKTSKIIGHGVKYVLESTHTLHLALEGAALGTHAWKWARTKGPSISLSPIAATKDSNQDKTHK